MSDSPKKPKIEYSSEKGLGKVVDKLDNIHDKASTIKANINNAPTKLRNQHRIKKGKDPIKLKYNPNLKDRNRETFLRAKGVKNKAKHVGNKVINKAKNWDFIKKIEGFIKKVKKFVTFIQTAGWPIFIGIGLIVFLANAAIYISAAADAIGTSPHYYCDIDPDDDVKQTALYKQYCSTGSSVNLENLQGHYIFQTDTGPCTSCALLNMYMRYFTNQGVNFFEYLPNSEGEYEKMVDDSTFGSVEMIWAVMEKGRGDNSYSSNSHQVAVNWYNQHGKPNAHFGTIGYLCNEDVFEDYEQPIIEFSDELSFDKELGYGGVTSYCCSGWKTGNFITLDGVTGTIVEEGSPSVAHIIDLLQDHPSGVELYVNYGGAEKHAILITSYDESTGEFMMVDSVICNNAGYEVPGNIQPWSECYQAFKNGSIVSCYYIQEDAP